MLCSGQVGGGGMYPFNVESFVLVSFMEECGTHLDLLLHLSRDELELLQSVVL